MGKSYRNRQCIECGEFKSGVESWGKFYCFECYEKRPKKHKGHSGLIYRDSLDMASYNTDEKGITLEKVRKSHPVFANLYLTHYPGSKGIFGRSINYLVRVDGKVAGIIGVNSPPLNYKKFVSFFGCKCTEKNYVNNNVFRLVIHDKNLGTQVLKLFRQVVKRDYEKLYKDTLAGIVTFVELPRTGAIYKADNWQCLGETQGISVKRSIFADANFTNKEFITGTTKKLIFAKAI